MLLEKRGMLRGTNHGQGNASNVLENAGGRGHVLIHEAGRSKIARDHGAGQVVRPTIADEPMVEALSEVRANCDSRTDALQMIGAEHGDDV
jgi:hypothetical protein